eukprot:265336_1
MAEEAKADKDVKPEKEQKGYLTVHVYIHVKKENIDDFIKASIENASKSINEKGVFRFDLIQDNEDDQKFMLVEVYKNKDAPAEHKKTDHYLKWRETVAPFMATPRSAKKYTDIYPLYSTLNT